MWVGSLKRLKTLDRTADKQPGADAALWDGVGAAAR